MKNKTKFTSSKNAPEENILGYEKIGKLLVKFSVPAIIGMVVNMLYNVIDRIYIGRIPGVGGLAITGVGITMPITTIITGIGMLIGAGTSASISLSFGSNNKERAQKVLSTGFISIIFSSIAVAILGNVFAPQIVHLFGGSDNTIIYALQYLRPLLFGTLFNLVAFGMNNSISSDGNPHIGMFTMIIGATINIILDPIFIFALNLGIRGAAYATVISQMFASCWVVLYFVKSKKATLHLNKKTLVFDFKICKDILAIGMAPFLMQLAGSLVQVISNKSLLTYGGDMAIGAMAVIVSICSVFIMPIFGLNHGAQPIIGFNYGAGKLERVKKTYLLGLTWCTIILVISYGIIALFPKACIALFNNDPELTKIAYEGIRIYLCSLPIIGIQMTASNYFQAIGKPKHAMLIGLTRQVIFLIPAFLIIPKFLGLQGIWIAGPTADILSVLISIIIMVREFKRINKQNLSI